jgi:1-acyl-sn-glycerol-3-phosphate acyltransferase
MNQGFFIFLSRIALFLSPVKAYHRERIPDGACIICPNHAAFRDPFCVGIAAGERTEIRYMAKAKYMDKPIIGAFIRYVGAFRVDPKNSVLSAVRESLAILKGGGKVCIFPEGTRNIRGVDLEGKAGAAMIAVMAGVPVVPVKIENSRKFFRIIRVTFGEAMVIEKVPRGGNYNAAAERIMEAIHSL